MVTENQGPANSAILSACGRWRWRLERHIGAGPVTAAVFGINPSTADASIDDATVRKWRGFAQRLGWQRVIVGNVFSWRATDVRELKTTPDPYGPEHMSNLERIIRDADILVPCWGDRGKLSKELRPEIDRMMSLLQTSGKPVHCWGLTAGGDPRHPLMLGYDTPLIPLSG